MFVLSSGMYVNATNPGTTIPTVSKKVRKVTIRNWQIVYGLFFKSLFNILGGQDLSKMQQMADVTNTIKNTTKIATYAIMRLLMKSSSACGSP